MQLDKLFFEPDEKEAGILGSTYLKKWLSEGRYIKSFGVVSDRRLYIRGKHFKKVKEAYLGSKDDFILELSNITETGFVASRHLFLVIYEILAIIWTVILGIMLVAEQYFDLWSILLTFGPICIGLLCHFLFPLNLFEICYEGGSVGFRVSDFDKKEIMEFNNQIKKAKEDYRPGKKSFAQHPHFNLFVDRDEKECAVLGGSYLMNWLATGSFEKGFCVVSDKRVYFRGKCYKKAGRTYTWLKEERTVDLCDVTGTGFVESRYFWLIITGIFTIIWALVWGVISISEWEYYEYELYLNMLLAIAPGIADILCYFFVRLKLFEVGYAGGRIAFKASNYKREDILEFQRQLRQAKDRYCANNQTVVQVSQPQQQTTQSSVADELNKYIELLNAGYITQEEFEVQKKKLIDNN